jgi:tetratricopeptide (TPR) repeat protein
MYETQEPLASAAARFGVQYVVKRSAPSDEQGTAICIELIDCATEKISWSRSFDLEPHQIARITQQALSDIMSALDIDRVPASTTHIRVASPVNSRAYDYYLRGKFLFKRRDQDSVAKAIELFTRALENDNRYSPAYSARAVAYTILRMYRLDQSGDCAARAKEDATRAIELDPGLSEAHVALATVQRNVSMRQTVTSLRTAIALDPKNSEAHHLLAHTYVLLGKYAEAALEERTALSIDPFQEISRAHLCRISFFLQRQDDIEQEINTLLENDLAVHLAHSTRGWIYWIERNWAEAAVSFEKGLNHPRPNMFTLDYLADCYRRLSRLTEACQCMDRARNLNPNHHQVHARAGQLFEFMGDRENARRCFDRATESLRHEFSLPAERVSPVYLYNSALITVLRNDLDSACRDLELAVEAGFGNHAELRLRPDFDLLRDNPRFRLLLEELPVRLLNQM